MSAPARERNSRTPTLDEHESARVVNECISGYACRVVVGFGEAAAEHRRDWSYDRFFEGRLGWNGWYDRGWIRMLEEVGTAAVMPLGAPIGTNKGLKTRELLEIIIAESRVPVVVDAGLGAPSHAAEALEMGADAVLVNTAIAVAGNPVEMAVALSIRA